MSELSELIIPAGVTLLGAFVVKKYFDTWQPDQWNPVTKTCIGPICWSQYGPPLSQVPTQGGSQSDYTNPGNGTGSTVTIDCNTVSPLLWWATPACWGTSAAGTGW